MVRDAEQRHNYRLRNDEREFIISCMIRRTHRKIDRWVRGAKSHPDERWRHCNFVHNLPQELDDAENYLDGILMYIIGNKQKV